MFQRQPPKPKLPETTRDLGLKSGAEGAEFRKVNDVRKVQKQLAEWFMDAALERWPDLLNGSQTELEVLEQVRINAEERWPGVDTLVDALNEAERNIYREAKQNLA